MARNSLTVDYASRDNVPPRALWGSLRTKILVRLITHGQ